MNRTTITARKLYKKHGNKYLFYLGGLTMDGMDIRTAIWECYNKFECGGING